MISFLEDIIDLTLTGIVFGVVIGGIVRIYSTAEMQLEMRNTQYNMFSKLKDIEAKLCDKIRSE